jgi:hypothetical protein
VQLGIVLLAIGVGLLLGNLYYPRSGYVIGGVIVAAVGIENLLSAAVSFRLLNRLGFSRRGESLSGDQRTV